MAVGQGGWVGRWNRFCQAQVSEILGLISMLQFRCKSKGAGPRLPANTNMNIWQQTSKMDSHVFCKQIAEGKTFLWLSLLAYSDKGGISICLTGKLTHNKQLCSISGHIQLNVLEELFFYGAQKMMNIWTIESLKSEYNFLCIALWTPKSHV